MEAESIPKQKICPKCKAEFSCSPTDCWCSKLPPIMPIHSDAECYCPDCLEKEIQKKIRQL